MYTSKSSKMHLLEPLKRPVHKKIWPTGDDFAPLCIEEFENINYKQIMRRTVNKTKILSSNTPSSLYISHRLLQSRGIAWVFPARRVQTIHVAVSRYRVVCAMDKGWSTTRWQTGATFILERKQTGHLQKHLKGRQWELCLHFAGRKNTSSLGCGCGSTGCLQWVNQS